MRISVTAMARIGWWSVAALAVLVVTNPSSAARAAAVSQPAAATYVSGSHAGEVVVSGTSTLHNWTVKSSAIQGRLVLALPAKAGGPGTPGSRQTTKAVAPSAAIRAIQLRIPVATLKSSEGSGMDNTVYHALKRRQDPVISYRLIRATLSSVPSAQDPAYHFDTVGQLTVAGVTQQVTLELNVLPEPSNQLTVTTTVPLKMTQFGVKPPTAMFGLIRSGDAIAVKATWLLTEAK